MIKGIIEFQGEKCLFDLDETTFRITIEKITNRNFDEQYVHKILSAEAFKSVFKGLLRGEIFDRGEFIHFNIYSLKQTNHNQFSGIVRSYLISHEAALEFDALDIQADELNYFYHPENSYSINIDGKQGNHAVNFRGYDETSDEFSFIFNKEHVDANLTMQGTFKYMSLNPIELYANLSLKFKEAKELSIAEDLTFLIRRLLMFVTFRRNVKINKLILKKKKTKCQTNVREIRGLLCKYS